MVPSPSLLSQGRRPWPGRTASLLPAASDVAREISSRAATAEARLLKRWFWSLMFVLLVAALAWLIWRYLFMPRTYFAYLPVTAYTKHEVPPVPYFETTRDRSKPRSNASGSAMPRRSPA